MSPFPMLCANRHAFRQHLRWWTNGGLLCPISEHAEDIMVTRSHRLIIYLSVSSHRLITSQPSSCFAGAGKLISFVQTYSIMSAEYPPRCPISWSSCLGSQSLPYPTLSILKKGLKRWDSPCCNLLDHLLPGVCYAASAARQRWPPALRLSGAYNPYAPMDANRQAPRSSYVTMCLDYYVDSPYVSSVHIRTQNCVGR